CLPLTLGALLFPVFSEARIQGQKTGCYANVRQLTTALKMYTQDNEGGAPGATNGSNAPYGYKKDYGTYIAPTVRAGGSRPATGQHSSYAFNERMARAKEGKGAVPADAVMLF